LAKKEILLEVELQKQIFDWSFLLCLWGILRLSIFLELAPPHVVFPWWRRSVDNHKCDIAALKFKKSYNVDYDAKSLTESVLCSSYKTSGIGANYRCLWKSFKITLCFELSVKHTLVVALLMSIKGSSLTVTDVCKAHAHS